MSYLLQSQIKRRARTGESIGLGSPYLCGTACCIGMELLESPATTTLMYCMFFNRDDPVLPPHWFASVLAKRMPAIAALCASPHGRMRMMQQPAVHKFLITDLNLYRAVLVNATAAVSKLATYLKSEHHLLFAKSARRCAGAAYQNRLFHAGLSYFNAPV